MTAAADGQELGSREIRVRVWGSARGGKQGREERGHSSCGPSGPLIRIRGSTGERGSGGDGKCGMVPGSCGRYRRKEMQLFQKTPWPLSSFLFFF